MRGSKRDAAQRSALPSLGLAAVGLAAYGFVEPHLYRLQTQELELRSGAPSVDVLHLSDTHLGPRTTRLREWLRALPGRLERQPDLVIATGDLIQGDGGIDPLIEAFQELKAGWGCYYVLGSHDYYVSSFQSYTKYFTGQRPVHARRANTVELEERLHQAGWVALTNTSTVLETPHGRVRLAGVDDPYLRRQRTGLIHRRKDEVLAIGLVHSPDVVSEWALAGFDLILAGHTHGGQVRIPGLGAVVTNCSLPAALAAGPHRVGSAWLHVSPGLGTSRFSPARFACLPEATLLRLVPGDPGLD
jgi:uncharacterized protein